MKMELLEKKHESPDSTTFLFLPEASLDFKPGQFLRYHLSDPKPDARSENRFFSIASAPFENRIQLTTKFVPDEGSTFKKDLHKLNIGDTIEAFGPSGSFTLEDPGKQYVFIAGGIGITPFRSMLLDLDRNDKPLNITLLYANRTSNILFKDEFEILAKKHPEFKIYFIISDEPVTEKYSAENIKMLPGKIDNNVTKSIIINLQSSIFYISGPEPMVQSVEKMLKELGIPKENIKRDEFPGYEEY